MWRLGQAKSHEGFPSVTSFKYLGVMLSYGNFEKATLKHRLQEGNAKLQQVRRFVHNRRTAGPRSRLHIWHSTVWATVSSGLVDVGLTEETAALLWAWHAKKIRAVLNCPAHLTHKSTSDLYRAHDIVDPVLKLQKRHANRVKRLFETASPFPDGGCSTGTASPGAGFISSRSVPVCHCAARCCGDSSGSCIAGNVPYLQSAV